LTPMVALRGVGLSVIFRYHSRRSR